MKKVSNRKESFLEDFTYTQLKLNEGGYKIRKSFELLETGLKEDESNRLKEFGVIFPAKSSNGKYLSIKLDTKSLDNYIVEEYSSLSFEDFEKGLLSFTKKFGVLGKNILVSLQNNEFKNNNLLLALDSVYYAFLNLLRIKKLIFLFKILKEKEINLLKEIMTVKETDEGMYNLLLIDFRGNKDIDFIRFNKNYDIKIIFETITFQLEFDKYKDLNDDASYLNLLRLYLVRKINEGLNENSRYQLLINHETNNIYHKLVISNLLGYMYYELTIMLCDSDRLRRCTYCNNFLNANEVRKNRELHSKCNERKKNKNRKKNNR